MVGSKRSECGTDRAREARRPCLRPPRRCTGGAAYGPLWRGRLDLSSPHSRLHGSPPARPLPSRASHAAPRRHVWAELRKYKTWFRSFASSSAGTVRPNGHDLQAHTQEYTVGNMNKPHYPLSTTPRLQKQHLAVLVSPSSLPGPKRHSSVSGLHPNPRGSPPGALRTPAHRPAARAM